MNKLYFILIISLHTFILNQIDTIQNITQYTFQYYPQLINRSEFTGGKTRRITLPGTYFLKEEINFDTVENGQDIICIEASNVTFILNDKTLFSSQNHTNTTAIRVKAGLSNIIIQRGSINQINGTGIVIEDSCTNIAIRDTLITNCNSGGIDIQSSQDCILNNLYISQCNNIDANKDVYGLKITNCQNFNLDNVLVRTISNIHKSAFGIYIDNGISINLQHCEAKLISGRTAHGFYQTNSRSCRLNSCSIENIVSANGNAYGRYYKNNINIAQIDSNTSSVISLSNNAYGYYMENCSQMHFQNCTSRDIDASSSPGNSYGFLTLNGKSNEFIECIATGGKGGTSTTSECLGINLSLLENKTYITNCDINSNYGGQGKGFGIRINETATFCIVKGNKIIANTGNIDGYGIFDKSLKSKHIYTNNFAYGNGKEDKTTLNNFEVYPAPSGKIEDFPVKQIYHTSYLELDKTSSENIEIIEAQ